MPPASPATTSVLRRASSSEVLPWSTWPMTVTTGGRGTTSAALSSSPAQAFQHVGFRHALDRMAVFGGDEFGGVGVDDVVRRRHHAASSSSTLMTSTDAARHAVGEFG